MAKPESPQIEEPLDKVVPITDPDDDQPGSAGGVKKRPFALDNKRGSGRGNMPLMLMVLGAIIVFGIGMVAFLSTKGTTKKKTAAEAAKPSLGRVAIANAPGDLVPSDKLKPSPDEVKKGGSIDAADIERTKASKTAKTQVASTLGTRKTGKPLNQVPAFQEPDTTPKGQGNWAPPAYGGSAGQHQELKREEDALSKPSLVFTAQGRKTVRSEPGLATRAVNNLGLAPGYHVAARLEAMATTAVHAPVTAIIEYNYERDGQILIPAGSRAVGKISQADPSG
jgi:hypothetical protein